MQCGFCGASLTWQAEKSPHGLHRWGHWSCGADPSPLWPHVTSVTSLLMYGHTGLSLDTWIWEQVLGYSSVQKQLSEQCHQIMHGLAGLKRQKGEGSWDKMVAPQECCPAPRLSGVSDLVSGR